MSALQCTKVQNRDGVKYDVLILLEHIFPNTYQGIISALYPAPDGFWLLKNLNHRPADYTVLINILKWKFDL